MIGNIKGKRAVVTGGSRGIGRAVARALANSGADVCITYHGDETAAKETRKLLEEAGARMPVALKGDAANPEFAKIVAVHMKDNFGGIDILVNNAGITDDGLLMRMSSEAFDRVVRTNLNGAFYMLREVAPFMLKQRAGRVINISSIAGVKGNAGQVNYAASKAGLIGLTLSAAKELGSRGITVNAIAPGFIDTDMTKVLTDKQKQDSLERVLLGRAGKPEEVAALAVFLASEEAGYITGQVVCIDGGLLM